MEPRGTATLDARLVRRALALSAALGAACAALLAAAGASSTGVAAGAALVTGGSMMREPSPTLVGTAVLAVDIALSRTPVALLAAAAALLLVASECALFSRELRPLAAIDRAAVEGRLRSVVLLAIAGGGMGEVAGAAARVPSAGNVATPAGTIGCLGLAVLTLLLARRRPG